MACFNLHIACQNNPCPNCEGRGGFRCYIGHGDYTEDDCEMCEGTGRARCYKPVATQPAQNCCDKAERNMNGWCTCCGDPPY